jgi:hypothetical protein
MTDFMDSKEQSGVDTQPWETQATSDSSQDARDDKDMYRMGKEQKFKVGSRNGSYGSCAYTC